MSKNNIFGAFLKEKRLQKEMSLRDLSNRIGVSHSYLDKIEKGVKAPPSDIILIKIEKTLMLDDESKRLFYETAAQSTKLSEKKFFVLPADISVYLSQLENARDFIRIAKKFGCDNDFWNELSQNLKKENMSQ